MAAGECAQRIDDLVTVEALVEKTVREASEILESLPKQILV
jgi:hypothetical protein